MNFEEVYHDFKIYASKQHKKQCLDTITQNFKLYVLPYFKDKNVNELTIQDIINWQDIILSKNFSNNYNKNIYQAFNSFGKYCVLNSYLDTNLISIVGNFKKKLEIHNYNVYTKREYKRFRKGLDNIIYKYFFDLLFYYGLRSGEAMALKLSDIQGNLLHIGKSMRRRGKREIELPKTSNSIRTLKIGFIMNIKFLILKSIYDKKFCLCDYDYFVFGGIKPLSPTSIDRHKHKACLKQNIREIKTHEFRHSYATRMINRGVPINIVSKNLGHYSVSITYDIYVHQKREVFHFSNTIIQNFKPVLSSIITHLCNYH